MAPPLTLRAAALLAAAAALLAEAAATAPRAVECVGQFAPCARPSQACSMNATRCAGCKAGQYVCPSDQKTCVDGPAGMCGALCNVLALIRSYGTVFGGSSIPSRIRTRNKRRNAV